MHLSQSKHAEVNAAANVLQATSSIIQTSQRLSEQLQHLQLCATALQGQAQRTFADQAVQVDILGSSYSSMLLPKGEGRYV